MYNPRVIYKNSMFNDCVQTLNPVVLPRQKSDAISTIFKQLYPLTDWGKIDWDKIDKKIEVGVNNPQDILPALEKLLPQDFDTTVYLEWDDGGLPIIKANLDDVIQHFETIRWVTFEKFIFNPLEGYIIEVRFSDTITVGLVPVPKEIRNELKSL